MHLTRTYSIFIISLLSSVFCVAQTIDEQSNWSKEIGKHDDYYSSFDFRRYTKSDIENAKAKYLLIASTIMNDEWTGSYRRETKLGSAEIIWDGKNGFVYSHVYHTLANIDYGIASSTADSVSFVSEKPTGPKRKSFSEGEHIFVKFGERHLLVPKNRLNEFAVWVVGREVPAERGKQELYTEDGFFWEKVGDEKKEIGDVPTFPKRYAHLIQTPIRSRILSVGKLRIKRDTSADWGTTSDEHLILLKLSVGQRQGVRRGMLFWIDELEDWVEVVSVSSNRSVAELARPFIKGKEYCSRIENHNQIEFPCRKPAIGMSLRTRVDYF